MTETEKKILTLLVTILDENKKISKKIKKLETDIETVAESTDTLIQIESERIKKER